VPQEAEPFDEGSHVSPTQPPNVEGVGSKDSTTPRWDKHQTRKKRSECETNDERNVTVAV
jgi:hypothetical protein